jgi:glycosyltransferase involved in cell wall biosynthesis
MFKDSPTLEIIPIFLAFQDELPEECKEKYSNIRVIQTEDDIYDSFKDIDVCINNLWIALDTIIKIKELFPDMSIISVCHSLIRMEHITNLGSQYTNNFNEQETTFQHSDYVVLISHAEEKYYNEFGYNLFDTKTQVIYNSYIPKCDQCEPTINYSSNDIGYIGRHVPRKRPEIPIKAVEYLKNEAIKVYNMGVDYDKYDNAYWRKLAKQYVDQLVVIPFSTDKKVKEDYWTKIGINCITGIYEPFGYTICESIDRGVPVIVQNIDGPKEIVEEIKEHVYMYNVDTDDYKQDILNFSKALEQIWSTPPDVRKQNAIQARKCLDKLRPEVISKEWEDMIRTI